MWGILVKIFVPATEVFFSTRQAAPIQVVRLLEGKTFCRGHKTRMVVTALRCTIETENEVAFNILSH